MKVFNMNPERKNKSKSDTWIKAGLFGLLLAVVFLGGLKLVGWAIRTALQYWIWVLVAVFAIIFVKGWMQNRKTDRLLKQKRLEAYDYVE